MEWGKSETTGDTKGVSTLLKKKAKRKSKQQTTYPPHSLSGWSPVIITTRMPACLQRATAFAAPALGGSLRDTRPAKTNPEVGGEAVSEEERVAYAKPSTRSPLSATLA